MLIDARKPPPSSSTPARRRTASCAPSCWRANPIGKTSVLVESRSGPALPRYLVLTGRGDDLERNRPLRAPLDAVRSFAGSAPTSGLDQRAAAVLELLNPDADDRPPTSRPAGAAGPSTAIEAGRGARTAPTGRHPPRRHPVDRSRHRRAPPIAPPQPPGPPDRAWSSRCVPRLLPLRSPRSSPSPRATGYPAPTRAHGRRRCRRAHGSDPRRRPGRAAAGRAGSSRWQPASTRRAPPGVPAPRAASGSRPVKPTLAETTIPEALRTHHAPIASQRFRPATVELLQHAAVLGSSFEVDHLTGPHCRGGRDRRPRRGGRIRSPGAGGGARREALRSATTSRTTLYEEMEPTHRAELHRRHARLLADRDAPTADIAAPVLLAQPDDEDDLVDLVRSTGGGAGRDLGSRPPCSCRGSVSSCWTQTIPAAASSRRTRSNR